MAYTLIRNLRGSWPQFYADMDNGDVVFIRIRHGYVWVGVGKTKGQAEGRSELVKSSADFCGVTGALEALEQLQERGFYYVPPAES